MAVEKNMQKYESYKAMHENLSKAMRNEFYYQAIFIEYAILEDRLSSVLKYASVSYTNRDGKDISISKKINKIRNREEFSNKFYKDRFTEELLDELLKWITERNDFIHHLAKLPYDSESVKKTAEKGYELVMLVQKRSASVIRHLNKLRTSSEE